MLDLQVVSKLRVRLAIAHALFSMAISCRRERLLHKHLQKLREERCDVCRQRIRLDNRLFDRNVPAQERLRTRAARKVVWP